MYHVLQLPLFLTVAIFALPLSSADDNKPQVIKGWGQVIDPDGDCKVTEDKGKLTIRVPGQHHDLNPALASNAPRVLQEVEGDFIATVKVTGDFKPGEKSTQPAGPPFNGAGLLIWVDNKNYLRLERNIWWIPEVGKHACFTPLLEYFEDGEQQNTNPGSTTQEFFKGRSTHLRFERKGDKVLAAYSHDGKEWIAVKNGVTVDLPKKVQVGVAAINSSNKKFVVEFEEFKLRSKD
ncbi:MAG: DUF1349 domain-containing protein [Fimbriiglobus sp.]